MFGKIRNLFEQSFLRRLSNFHRKGKDYNLFIFSLPRSGSTWLQELIWTQPGFKYINEPLNLKNSWLQKKSGIKGFEELYSPEGKKKAINYFKGFCEGRFHFLDPNPVRKYYRPITNRLVFKIIHGGEMFINDIVKGCNGRVIYLLRHPIPVSLSRKQLPRMEQLCSNFVLDQFEPGIKEYALTVNSNGTPMERRILAWCIQNKLALMQRTDDWMVISYEQLVTNPKPIIDRMVKEYNLSKPNRIYNQINIPSAVSVQSTAEDVANMMGEGKNREKLVEKWKNRLETEEINTYMNICANMNMLIYSENSGMPNPEWLIN